MGRNVIYQCRPEVMGFNWKSYLVLISSCHRYCSYRRNFGPLSFTLYVSAVCLQLLRPNILLLMGFYDDLAMVLFFVFKDDFIESNISRKHMSFQKAITKVS